MFILKMSIDYFFNVVQYLIIARILLSWLNQNPHGGMYSLIYQLTEPILAPFRELLFKIGLGGTMIDFSPVVAVMALDMIKRILFNLL